MQTKRLPNNIFLIGPMGAGKSTIGRQLAENIHYAFYDSDKVIADKTGVDIPTIFDYEGEIGFRKREAEITQELVNKNNIVLATGGGTILNVHTCQQLREKGYVIYLKTTVAEQLIRIGNDKNRPLMQTDDPEGRLTELMQERVPLYEATADLIFNTNHHKINNIPKELINRMTAQ